MKQRLYVSLAALITLIVLFPYTLIYFESFGQGVFVLVSIFTIAMIFYYIYGGIAKLLTHLIYFVILILGLFALPDTYQVFVSLVITFALLTHPLSRLEEKINKVFSKEFTTPIKISISGSYWPYFEYRREMKEFYHLPQSKKLHQNKRYLFFRQFVTIVLLFLGTFVLLQETQSIGNDLNAFEWDAFFNIYLSLWIFLMAFYSYKKGFTTVFRALVIGFIPVFLYVISISNLELLFKLILMSIFMLISLAVIVIEWYQYYQRVSFDTFTYIDQEKQLKVYANSLFEPLIYNDTYILSATYRIKISLDTFHKFFQSILVYANFHKILITAYAYGNEMLYVFADFHYQDRVKVDRFKTFMESKFHIGIPYELEEDKHKTLYEKNFFHRKPYILARAKHLGWILKEISNEPLIVLTTIMYFQSLRDVHAFERRYKLQKLSDIYVSEYYTVKVDLPVMNNDHVIESSLQRMLSEMETHGGTFVRIIVSKIDLK